MPNRKNLFRHVFWVLFLAFALGVLSLFFFDESLALYFDQQWLRGFRKICRELTDLALGDLYFGIAMIGYLLSRWIFPLLPWFQSRAVLLARIRFAAGFSFITLLIVGICNTLLKFLFGRARPHVFDTFIPSDFQPFNTHWHWHSMPSGHSQVIFVIATLASLAWPRWKFLFLFIAACLAFTRVIVHQHFLSDVIIGCSVGYVGTLLVYQGYLDRKQKKSLAT